MILRLFFGIGSLYLLYPVCSFVYKEKLTNPDSKFYDEVGMPLRFVENEIIPDLVELPPPTRLLVTIFNGQGKAFYPGEELKRWDFFRPPDNFSWATEPDAYYTLFFSTPDHPLDTKWKNFRQIHHWLVANIPGHDVWKGDVLLKYHAPLRYDDIGYCRYVFLVYKQSRMIKAPEEDDLVTGLNVSFTCNEFARKFRLSRLWAGNFFTIYY